MGTFNDGDSGSSIRTKINTAIQKTEGSSAISTIDVDGGAIDGVTLGTNSAVTEAQVDNININGNAITSTDSNGNIALTPNGSGEVDISKVDIDSGAIDGVTIGTNSAVTDLRVDNLKVDGNTISSTDTNGDVTIDPNGTGDVNIGNFKFDADQSVGAGQDNYVLTYDNSGGKISLEAAAGGGGGAHTLISTTNVTSGVAQIDISLSGTYEKYLLTYINVVASGDTNEALRLRVSDDGGSSFETGSTYTYRGVSWYSLADDTRGSGDPSNFGTGADSIHIKEASAQRDGVQHGEIHIYDPHNSSNDFTCYCTFVGQGDATGGGVAGGVTTGSFNVAADYNAIRLYFNGDNMTSGEFKLFGVS